MLEELKKLEEEGIEKKELAEDWLSVENIKKKFPKTYEDTKQVIEDLEKDTLRIKEEKEYQKVIKRLEKLVKESGFKELLILDGKKATIGRLLNFLIVSKEYLSNLKRLEFYAKELAEKGLSLEVEFVSEYLRGGAFEISKKIWEKTEEISNLKEGGKSTTQLKEELEKLRNSMEGYLFDQFAEKKEIKDIATREVLGLCFEKGIEELLKNKINEEEERKYLSIQYKKLKEEEINQIIKEEKKIEEELEKGYHQKLEELGFKKPTIAS